MQIVMGFVLLLLAACGERAVDWSEPEAVIMSEAMSQDGEAVKLDYRSLIDAPCRALYDALVDVEHYPDFIPGIDTAQILARTDKTVTVLMAQRVINRTASAKADGASIPARRSFSSSGRSPATRPSMTGDTPSRRRRTARAASCGAPSW